MMAFRQLNCACLWENGSIVLLLSFVAILVLHLLWRLAFARMSSDDETSAYQKSQRGELKKFSSRHKISIVCSISLLGTHVLTMLLMLRGESGRRHCTSMVPGLWAETLQIISWAVSLTALHRVIYKMNANFPSILRFWWMCNFLLSVIRTALDSQLVITDRDHHNLNLQDYVDFLALFASTCLFPISIQGITGGVFYSAERDGANEPLLVNEKTVEKDLQGGCKRESIYAEATLLQLITFSWLNPLFAVGIKKPLKQDEIPDVDFKDSANFLSCSFDECLEKVKHKDGTTNPSIYKAIFLLIRKKAGVNVVLAVISAGASYVGPYLINDFVHFLAERETTGIERGYLLAIAFFSAKMVESITQQQWVFGARQLGCRLSASLISHTYNKGLVLSSKSRQRHGSGEIINYMSVDIERISDFVVYSNIILMLPVKISLAIYILHRSLGLGSLAGLGATLMVMACNIPITRVQKRYQSKIMDAKDERMKAISEILRNMKTLKLQGWDSQYLHKLETLRSVEYNWIWKSLRLSALSSVVFWGSPTFISVITFGSCMLMGIPLTAGRVLSALATFRMLQDPIFGLPDILSAVSQGKVSADRVASFLQEGEIQSNATEFVSKEETEFDIEINNGRFSWEAGSNIPTLDGIELKVKRGMKVAICGTVGSGKSSLISCILGEVEKQSGTVKISGTKAYVPQSPWIFTGDIRDNILFGNPYDNIKYYDTVKACALEKDFQLFSAGDRTEIGERGINMSGGQKQRIQIARAVYQDADIYLMDDPFSAVDAHTGTQLFEDCILKLLKDKTILYVTHQVEFLPAADLILLMQNGKIAQAGTFEELLKQNVGFETLVSAHSQALESIFTVETSSRTSQEPKTEGESTTNTTSNGEVLYNNHESENNISVEKAENGGRLTQEEEREKGSIGKEVYWSYLTIVKGGALVPIILLAQSMFQVLQIASNSWMAWASPPTTDVKPVFGMKFILLVYVLLAVGSSLCVLVRASLVAIAGLSTSQKLFTNMLCSIFRAPMAFFDSTPTGRILNRASTDQSLLDLEIANILGRCTFFTIQLLGTIAVMSQIAWEVFVIFIPVTAISIWYQQYYIPTARELARLEGIQRAPILHHFAESLSGAATIRAFGQEERFTDANLGLIDNHSRPWFHNVAAMEWLLLRLNVLSHLIFALFLLLLVSLPEGSIHPSIAGLAVTYGINLNVLQSNVIWNICNAENKMISVERILQYSKLPSEAPLVIDGCRPADNWPETGSIMFKNLEIRYAEHLPSVLKNINCTFPGRKKVGVVGRTGSGKSTLIQAIFRIVEPRVGSITIDGVDISTIGLHDLRSRLSIIPQDPAMFEGSSRINLDPLEQYSDTEIWEALDKCQLGDLVRAKDEKLDTPVAENGENWSVGQRQLFCLGRALLKKSSILVLDEATASVDSATDGVIQKILSQEFRDRTVVTIAHRIHTVIDSDLVLVLSEGRIAEYDTPAKLLEEEDTLFSKLIKEYSMRSPSFNRCTNLQT